MRSGFRRTASVTRLRFDKLAALIGGWHAGDGLGWLLCNGAGVSAYALLTVGQRVQGEHAMSTAPATDDAPRSKEFLLAKAEGRVLEWIARRLPARVMPDHMTAVGVLAAVGIAAAYLLSNGDQAWLWAASALLVVQWLGDSLDGTLARVRRIERPKYGYYLDHLVDAVATALIGIGLGLSPWMLLSIGLLIVIAYLVLSINTYLETYAFGVFTLGYGRIGPTEVRLVLIALNTLIALGVGLGFEVGGLGLTVLDLVGIGIAAVMGAGLAGRAARNLRRLAELEPAARA
jgi:phosphatidylglycerophosphate synthase